MVGGRGFGGRILRLYLPLAFFLVAMLFPFYWMAITSIKPNRELYNPRIMPLIVHQPTLKHYYDLLRARRTSSCGRTTRCSSRSSPR